MNQGNEAEDTAAKPAVTEAVPTKVAATEANDVAVAFDAQLCGVKGPLESLTFEELLAALELVTARLANGDLGIEAAADLYEQAEILHAAAQDRLAAVEARIARLRGRPPS